MKHLISLCLATFAVTAMTASAQSCSLVRSGEVAKNLYDSGFPADLLGKAHVAALGLYGDFCQRKWGFGPYEDWSLYASRQLDAAHWETVIFSVFEFPDHAVGAKEIERRMVQESFAKHNPDTNIYYYLKPLSGVVFRVSRARHVLGD